MAVQAGRIAFQPASHPAGIAVTLFDASGGLDPRTVLEIAFVAFATLLGATFRAFTGFGAGLFLVPTFSMFLSPPQAIVVVTLLNMPTTVQLLPAVAAEIPWRRVLPLTIAALVTIPFGVYLITVLDADHLRRSIGAVVILFSLLLLSGWRYSGRQGLPQDICVGTATGIIAGTTGMGGPPVVIYLLSGNTAATVARAAFIAAFAAITVSTLASFAIAGLVDRTDFWWTLGLLPVYALGTWIGNHLHLRTRHMDKVFRVVGLSALLLIGIFAVAS